MRPRPGSLAFLLANDVRLSRRRFADIFRGLGPRGRAVLLVVVVLGVHLLALPVAHLMVAAGKPGGDQAMLWGGAAAGVLFALSWMTAQSLLNTTRALFQRNDLDLLLSAPIPPRRIAAARLLALATENFASAAIFVLPVANAAAFLGDARWLGVYPTLLALALVAAALGLAQSLLLLAVFGPRRTRAASQILATVIGAVVALSIQLAAVLPPDLRRGVMTSLRSLTEAAGAHAGAHAGVQGWAWLPVRAAMGDGLGIPVMLLLGAAALALATVYLGTRFVSGALRAAGAAPADQSSAMTHSRRPFTPGIAASLRRKEWRLLRRDPWILGQLFLQIVYTLPVALILWRSGVGGGSPLVAVTPSLVVVAAQISGSLAWIAISGEDAPEFMATAPVPRARVDLAKLQVIATVVLALLALPLAGLALSRPLGALAAAVFCVAAGASTALVNLWHPSEGRRRSFMRRHAQSKLVGMLEHALAMLWAVAAVLAMMGTMISLVPVALALIVLALAWRWLAGGRLRPLLARPLLAPWRRRLPRTLVTSRPA